MKTLPIIKLLTAYLDGNNLLTTLEVSESNLNYFVEPIAPASLTTNSNEEYILHKLLNSSNVTFSFITYDYNGKIPSLEESYEFRSWFTAEQYKLLLSDINSWKLKELPTDGSICYDDLTWAAIENPLKKDKAFTNGTNWISINTFNNFIKNDFFHIKDSSTKN